MNKIYTKKELLNLTTEEIYKLSYVETEREIIHIKEIKSFSKDNGLFIITTYDGVELHTESKETFRQILDKKATYELIHKTLSDTTTDLEYKDNLTKLIQEDIHKTLSEIDKKTDILMSNIENKVEGILKDITSKTSNFTNDISKLDINYLQTLIKEVEVITKSFNTLLN